MCKGFIDSLKGGYTLFYMDKQINEKLIQKSLAKTDKRRGPYRDSPSKYYDPKRYE